MHNTDKTTVMLWLLSVITGAAQTCLAANCTPEEQATALSLQNALCGSRESLSELECTKPFNYLSSLVPHQLLVALFILTFKRISVRYRSSHRHPYLGLVLDFQHSHPHRNRRFLPLQRSRKSSSFHTKTTSNHTNHPSPLIPSHSPPPPNPSPPQSSPEPPPQPAPQPPPPSPPLSPPSKHQSPPPSPLSVNPPLHQSPPPSLPPRASSPPPALSLPRVLDLSLLLGRLLRPRLLPPVLELLEGLRLAEESRERSWLVLRDWLLWVGLWSLDSKRVGLKLRADYRDRELVDRV